MQLAAAFAAGAGFSLAAAHLVMRRRGARPRVSDARSGAPEAGLPVPCDSELGVPTPPRCEGADWGSPVMPRSEQEEGNRTMSPSKLPRPRKLFADAGDGEVALVDYQLTHVISAGALRLGSRELHLDKYVQPASIDLPISGTVFLVKEKVLPFRKQVRQLVEGLVLEEKEFGSNGTVLLKGQTYLVFCGTVRLPVGCRGCLSPKSSIGRVDVMVRGVVDGCGLYDIVPGDGKERELWLEISPRSFNVRVSPGSAMTQLMLFMSPDRMVECGLPVLDSTQIHSHRGAVAASHDAPQAPATRTTREGVLGGAIESMATIDHSFEVERGGEDERGAAEQDAAAPTTPLRCGSGGEDDAVGESMEEELEAKICYDDDGKVLPLHLHKGALVLSVCIPSDQAVIAGYEAIATEEVIDLSLVGAHDPAKFFRPIMAHTGGSADSRLTLEKDRFYILATKERVSIPVHLSAEMVPFSHHVGELRAHYAGFFDPGFGFGTHGDLRGAIGVLEVRPHETINIYHGQPICLMEFFRNASVPMRPYGSVGNNYQGQQGPKLAKYFAPTVGASAITAA